MLYGIVVRKLLIDLHRIKGLSLIYNTITIKKIKRVNTHFMNVQQHNFIWRLKSHILEF